MLGLASGYQDVMSKATGVVAKVLEAYKQLTRRQEATVTDPQASSIFCAGNGGVEKTAQPGKL